MRRVIVRYKVKPERVTENEEFVRAVYEELDRSRPERFHYATFKLDGGVSFVHLATHAAADNPLHEIEAFRRFQEGIRERCEEPPLVSELHEVGAFRFREGPI